MTPLTPALLWAVRSKVALRWLVPNLTLVLTCGPPCRQLPGTGGSSRNGGEASSVIDLSYSKEPSSGPPLRFQIPFETSTPQGAEDLRARSRIRLSLISQPTREDRECKVPQGWAEISKAQGYHPGGLGLTLGLHNLLPLFLLCLFHQELGPLGLLLGCDGRVRRSQM